MYHQNNLMQESQNARQNWSTERNAHCRRGPGIRKKEKCTLFQFRRI